MAGSPACSTVYDLVMLSSGLRMEITTLFTQIATTMIASLEQVEAVDGRYRDPSVENPRTPPSVWNTCIYYR